MCCTCKVAFLLIRPIVFFLPFSLPSPLSIIRFYILFEQTTKIIESIAFSLVKSIYYVTITAVLFVTENILTSRHLVGQRKRDYNIPHDQRGGKNMNIGNREFDIREL